MALIITDFVGISLSYNCIIAHMTFCNHELNMILKKYIFLVTTFIFREIDVYRKKSKIEVN